jgi:hypothetical protein
MDLHCVICTNLIPEEREIKKAVTCSADCKLKLKAIRRAARDMKICRQCNRPSTPEERKLFTAWRRATEPQPKRGRPRLTPKKEEQDAM